MLFRSPSPDRSRAGRASDPSAACSRCRDEPVPFSPNVQCDLRRNTLSIRSHSAAKACSSATAADNRSDLGDRLRGGLQRPFDLQSPLPAYHGYDTRLLANGAALVLSATAFRRRRSIGAGTESKCRCPPGWRSRQLQIGHGLPVWPKERPRWGCAVTRRRFPVGASPTRRFAPAGSNRSRHGGDEMSEAFG